MSCGATSPKCILLVLIALSGIKKCQTSCEDPSAVATPDKGSKPKEEREC